MKDKDFITIDRMGYTHYNVLVPKEMFVNHGVTSFPTILAFDKSLKFVFKAVGWNDFISDQLTEILEYFNKE
jgi:thioredoxin-related protein